MNRVVHFELGAVNTARAVEFYKNVFGWEAQQWGGPQAYWLIVLYQRKPALERCIARTLSMLKDLGHSAPARIGKRSLDHLFIAAVSGNLDSGTG